MIVNNNDTPGISQLNVDQANLTKSQAASRSTGAGAVDYSTSDSSPGDDSISLSNSQNYVQLALNSTSPARSSRVQELKALVQNNQYQPDAQEVSRALIDAHLTGA